MIIIFDILLGFYFEWFFIFLCVVVYYGYWFFYWEGVIVGDECWELFFLLVLGDIEVYVVFEFYIYLLESKLVINEILFKSGVVGDWLELYNGFKEWFNLVKWILSDFK